MSTVPNPARGDRFYTAADVAQAFQAGLELGQRAHATRDDGGFAERFLEQLQKERLAAHSPDGSPPALRLLTEDQVNDVLDGSPAPAGLDPEMIAAARRIALRLNNGRR
jgi:hypothetical protein